MAETLQLIITGDNKEAIQAIQDTIKSTEGLKSQFKTLGSASAQANQALVNSGRVLQDLNYGFVGIANNLNPLLESFQRLSERSKDTGTSIKKELVAALTGPAGIGIALSTVTFIALKFGDDISKFISNLSNGGESLRNYKDSLSAIGGDFTSAAEKVNKVEAAFNSYHKNLITGKEALRIYNEELGKNFGVKKDINEAEKAFKEKTGDYINASLQRALADAASKKAAEELLKQKLLELKSISEYKGFVSGATVSGQIDVVNYKEINKRTAQGFKDVEVNAQKAIVESFKQIQKTAQEEADRLSTKAGIDLDPEKIVKSKVTKPAAKKEQFDYVTAIQKRAILVGGEPEEVKDDIDDVIKYAQKQQSDYENWLSNLFRRKQKESDKRNDEEKRDLKKQKKEYEDFADTLSKTVTGAIMNMWDSMQRGESVLQALGDMLGQIVQKFIAAIIQASIFAGIMAIIPGLGAGGGFGATVKKILGFADGGIITKPTYGVVGEGGQGEAIMPLSKLGNMINNTFQAGAMAGVGGGGGGTVTLRGQDLLIALNRTQKASNLKGQSISLA